MDLLSFTPLRKSIFIKSTGKILNFARHHFRNDFFRNLSNYVEDLILTDNKNHPKYEDYSEAEMLVIINGFDKMMEMKGSGIDGAITKNDIINIFEGKGKEWVLNGRTGETGKGWFSDEKRFDRMLIEFNERKNILINEGLEQFLIARYDTIYERFYLNIPQGANADDFYSLVFPQPSLGDFSMLMNLESGFFYPEY